MSKNSAAVYGASGRTNLLTFNPDDLVIVTDAKSPLFDERHALPVSESLVKNIMFHGVLEPIIVCKNPETSKTEVVAGRQRVKAAREANRRLAEQGAELITVPAVVRRGDDASLAGIMVSENEVREDDTPMGRAKKMQRLQDMGKSDEELAILFGCTKVTIKNILSLLECCADVRKAVEMGKITISAAYKLSKLDADAQRTTVAKMIEAGEGATGKRERSQAISAASGDVKGPSKKDVKAYRDELIAAGLDLENEVVAALDWVLGARKNPNAKRVKTAAVKAA